ncbi:MAG: PD-(D/E)XK nuclease family protein, partial [Corynebacterium flavescens]
MASSHNTPRPIALSPSRASDYTQCPLLYRFRAIDRLPEPKTVAQVRGTLVHAVLEHMHDLPREERTYPAAVKMIKPEWATMAEKDAELSQLISPDKELEFFVEARSLIKGYFQMENPQGFDAADTEMYVNTV